MNDSENKEKEIDKENEDKIGESPEISLDNTPTPSSSTGVVLPTSPSSTLISKKDLKKQEKDKAKEEKERAREEKERKEKEDRDNKERQKQKEREDKERKEKEDKENKEKLKLKSKEEKRSKILSPKNSKYQVQKTNSQDNLNEISVVKPLTPTNNIETSINLENKNSVDTDNNNNENVEKEEKEETTITTTSNSPIEELQTQEKDKKEIISHDKKESQPIPIVSKSGSSKDVLITVTRAYAPVVHQNILSEDGENKMRNKVINEIINTEKDYISDLNVIINFILLPLKELKLITDKDISIIFSNIQLLVGVNKELLNDLEKAANQTQGSSIGPCFKFFSEYLKIYSSYCSNQQISAGHIQQCIKKSPQLKQFLDEKQQSSECRQFPLDSFLIKPIQRLCKYPLLIRELIRNSVDGHSDIQTLEEAYAKIQTVVLSVNESKRKAEVLQKMYKIHEKLETTEKFDFLTPTRYLIREDTLRELTEEKEKVSGKMHYYLFNDIIMRTKKDKKSIKLETLFLIASTKVNSEENRLSNFCNTFELCQLGREGRKFTLVCDNYEQKMEWVTDIETLIRPYEEESMREYEKLLDETFLAKRSTVATSTPSNQPDSPKSLARSVTASTLQLSKPLPPPPKPSANNITNSKSNSSNNLDINNKKKPPITLSPPPPTTINNNNNIIIDKSINETNSNNSITVPSIPVINRPKPVGNRRITSSVLTSKDHDNEQTNNNSSSSNNNKILNRTSLQIQNSSPTPTSSDNIPNKYQFKPIMKSNSNSNILQSPDSNNTTPSSPVSPSSPTTITTTPATSKPSGRPLPKPKESLISTPVSSPVNSPINSPPTSTPIIEEKVIPLQKFPSMANLKFNSGAGKSVSTFTPSKSREIMEQHNQQQQPITTTKDDMDISLSKSSSLPQPKINRIMPLPPGPNYAGSPITNTSSDSSPGRQIPKPLPTVPAVVPPVLPKRNSIVPK